MVSQKRLEYGFNGYQVPVTPRATRATRSARRRATCQRRVEDNKLCAFDLLATVAGKLLQEKKTSTTSIDTSTQKDQYGFVKEECQDANKPLKAELSDEGSCDRTCSSDLSSQACDQYCSLKQLPRPEIDGHSGVASIVASSNCSARFVAEKLVDSKSHHEMENFARKVELGSLGCAEFGGCKFAGDISKVKDELHKIGKVTIGSGTQIRSLEDPLDEKPPALISLGSNAKLSGFDDNIPCSSLSEGCDNAPVVSRDDDENFFRCTHPSTKTKPFRPMTHIGARRIRKILASKYWKVALESKDDTFSNSDGNLKTICQSRKNFFKHQRSQMNIPFKKRKLFARSSVSNSDRYIRSHGTSYSPEKCMNQDATCSSHRMCGDLGMLPSLACQHTAIQSKDSHVKLRIKSFRVPELFIEIPETATVGSLKRTVMEAVTAILGGGLHVGVILQGKKVRDDNKTLLQTGISHDNQLDALGFTLEPNSTQSLPPIDAVESPHVTHVDMPQPLTRYSSSVAVVHKRTQGSSVMLTEHQVTSSGNLVESDHDSAPSPVNHISVDKSTTDCKALVTFPEMGMEALAVLPVHQKSKRSEIMQRRIRRPFSVAEVEALVQAVEKLGTGRWRDIKLCAFDNAKHRTYVDLKDKWKTLVHTARISPQQRRGEPVPQELLDRVLTAHAYWSQLQSKQQVKQQPETCFLV